MILEEDKRVLSGYTLSKVSYMPINGEEIIDFKFNKGDHYVGCTLYHIKGEEMLHTLKRLESFIKSMVEELWNKEERTVSEWAQNGRMT